MILKGGRGFNEGVRAMRNDLVPVLWRRRAHRCFHEFEVCRVFIRDNEEAASVMFDAVLHASAPGSEYLKWAVGSIGIQRLPLPGQRGMGEKCDVGQRAGLVEE